MKPAHLAAALCLPLVTSPTLADTQQRQLDNITVVSTRTERAISDVAATVSVKSREELEREITRDIADLVRFEPGVSVAGGDRFGLSGFNIRGIEGNRVLTLVDGVRVPEEFSFGPFLSSRRDFVDIDSVDRVEIARGPISSLYGSDALGGVVAFATKNPFDYLRDEDTYVGYKGGYSSSDDSMVNTLNLAAGSDQFAALLTFTDRSSSETDTSGNIGGTGSSREQADPQDIDNQNVLVKFAYRPVEGHEFILTADQFNSDVSSQILSQYGLISRGTLINSRDAEDERERHLLSLRYLYNGETVFADAIQLTAYRQSSESDQLTDEVRKNGVETRFRLSTFEQKIEGFTGQLDKAITLAGNDHFLTYGFDYYRTDNQNARDGASFDAAGNLLPTSPFAPPLPTRDFPKTEVTQLAFFFQDEITLLNERLTLSPGVRYDRFDAKPEADALYLSGNPGSPLPADFEDSEVTFKLGAIYEISDGVSIYGRYSEGFRTPPYDDVNVGFSNFLGGYKTIANPDLESENSKGYEVGARWEIAAGELSLAIFDNDYDNFIESFATAPAFTATGGIDPADGLRTFQSVNLDEVNIRGIELSGGLFLGELNRALENFSLRASIAYARGEEKSTGEPLSSVEPLSAVFGLRYDHPNGRLGGDVIVSLVKNKSASDIASGDPQLATAGYGIVDLLANYQVNDSVRVNLGLFNLGDKEYIRYADTRNISGAEARFSQPGFNVGVNLRVEF